MENKTIKAIKGMNKDMTCRGHQFKEGETYEVEGEVKVCDNGFHSCPDDVHPLSVFTYYSPGNSRYFNVENSGGLAQDGNKVASAKITIGAEIKLHGLIERAIKFVFDRVKYSGAASNSGGYGAASNSGYSGAASNSGRYGAASNSGDHGAASNSGYSGAASNSGRYGAASNSGDHGAASNSGYSGAASNSGRYGAASNSGDHGAASNSGYYGAASNSGDHGAASNSGYSGAASNSGRYGAASNSGDHGAASNSGYYGAAMSHAYKGRVMAEGDGQALYCSEIGDNGEVLSVACGIVGKKGIKPGVWYTAKRGRLVRVK